MCPSCALLAIPSSSSPKVPNVLSVNVQLESQLLGCDTKVLYKTTEFVNIHAGHGNRIRKVKFQHSVFGVGVQGYAGSLGSLLQVVEFEGLLENPVIDGIHARKQRVEKEAVTLGGHFKDNEKFVGVLQKANALFVQDQVLGESHLLTDNGQHFVDATAVISGLFRHLLIPTHQEPPLRSFFAPFQHGTTKGRFLFCF